MRAYASQVEVLRRLRNGGQQFVRVEHVHVNDGGQAVIGNVRTRGDGNGSGSRVTQERVRTEPKPHPDQKEDPYER